MAGLSVCVCSAYITIQYIRCWKSLLYHLRTIIDRPLYYLQAKVYFTPSSAIPGDDGLYYSSGGFPLSNVCCRPTVNTIEVYMATAVAATS